jgi:hypothetical protein
MDARDDLAFDAFTKNARRPQPDEMRSIFAGLGLGDDFGDRQSDSFNV